MPAWKQSLEHVEASLALAPDSSDLVKWLQAAEPVPELKEFRPYWNLWIENHQAGATRQPRFQEPLERLEPGSRYLVFLDLAALPYKTPAGPTPSRVAPPLISKWLQDLLRDNSRTRAELTVVLVPDPDLFELPDTMSQPLEIDLDQVRRWLRREKGPPPDAWTERSQGGLPDFLFGSVPAFELTTRPNIPYARAGWISVSFWVHGRPLGELPVPYCIAPPEDADSCDVEPKFSNPRDSGWGKAMFEEADAPDASLYFQQFYQGNQQEPSPPIGVFWCRECGYHLWQLEAKSLKELGDVIQQQVLSLKSNDWPLKGRVLFQGLFPPPDAQYWPADKDRRLRQARKAFASFLASRLEPGIAGSRVPKIFVRAVTGDGSKPVRLPIGLIPASQVFEYSDVQKPPAATEDAYLGFRFLIETPLPDSRFGAAEGCVSRWLMALPSEKNLGANDGDLKTALTRLAGGKISQWQTAGLFEPLDDVDRLGNWLTEEVTEEQPLAFVVLSHHDPAKGHLFYSDNGTRVGASVARKFNEGSLAILNACGTGSMGLWGFAEAFNRQHVSAAIVTGTEVHPALAGDFLVCLSEQVTDGAATPARPVADVFFDTLLCLREKKFAATPHGASALVYLLLGNGNLRLCTPQKLHQEAP